jgi:hypothetical protein
MERGEGWDVLVASHSWSELPMDTFHMCVITLIRQPA